VAGTGESVSGALASAAIAAAAAAAGAPAEAEDPDAARIDPPALGLEVDEDDTAWLSRGSDSATDLRGQRRCHEARATTLAESASTPACPSFFRPKPPQPRDPRRYRREKLGCYFGGRA